MTKAEKTEKSIRNWLLGERTRTGNTCYEGTHLLSYGDKLYSYGSHWCLTKKLSDGRILINVDTRTGYRQSDTPFQQRVINRLAKELGLPYVNISASTVRRFINFDNITEKNILCSTDAIETPVIVCIKSKFVKHSEATKYKLTKWGGFRANEEGEYKVISRELYYADTEKEYLSGEIPVVEGLRVFDMPYSFPNGYTTLHESYERERKTEYIIGKAHTTGEVILTVPMRDIGRETGFGLSYDGVFLCGVDENQYFVAQLPTQGERVYNVETREYENRITPEYARKLLRPDHFTDYTEYKRQGEWFFTKAGDTILDAVTEMFGTRTLTMGKPESIDIVHKMLQRLIPNDILRDMITRRLWREWDKIRGVEGEFSVLCAKVIEKHIKKIELPRKNNMGNIHSVRGVDFGNGQYLVTGTVRHSAREHAPLDLGNAFYSVHKNREIDSATATSNVD